MENSKPTPIVYFACVNSTQKGKKLNYLFNERQILSDLLSFGTAQPKFLAVQKEEMRNPYFFPDFIHNEYFQKRVRILHFTGHAEDEHFRIEAGKSEWYVHVDELARVIDLLPNLELVYLNGCATPKLLDMLVRRDIPAVMVSETRKKDRRSLSIAKAFYRELSKGASISQALGRVRKKHPKFGAFRLGYEVETDSFQWPFELDEIGEGKLPWGLYFLKDHESTLFKPLSIFEEKQKVREMTRPKNHPRKSWTYVAAAAIAALSAIGTSLYLSQVPLASLSSLLIY